MSTLPIEARPSQVARARLTAADVMTSPVITVRPDATVKEIASLMLAHHISGLPVVSADDVMVGIVTESDLLHKERSPRLPRPAVPRALRRFSRSGAVEKKASGCAAADLMSAPVVTVDEATPLYEIAALMVGRGINRVPVMRAGRLSGIVSRADIMRAFTRTDAEVAGAVRATLLHELWVDVSQVDIDVRDGVVSLAGKVERRSECDLVTRWAATVDGVISVTNRLEFEYDDRDVRLGDRWPAQRA
jgi:CBS domain-containing protein